MFRSERAITEVLHVYSTPATKTGQQVQNLLEVNYRQPYCITLLS